MYDTGPGGPPLHVARPQLATVLLRILVLHFAGQQIRYCFKTTVRVIGRADTLARTPRHRPQMIEQQKRVDVQPVGRWKRATHRETAPLERLMSRND